MSDAFTVLWTQDTCRALRKEGRAGERPSVAFSGIHTSLPSWGGARPGDDVYALQVNQCAVYVVSRMRVVDKERRDCCDGGSPGRREQGFPGHSAWSMLGAGGCGASAVHVDSTPVRFDVPVPGDLLARLTWRNARGRTRNPKYVVDGRLERAVGLQGFYRLAPESADALAELAELTQEAA
ncbi:hypothetical protein ACIRUY_32345 [Streptomyces erythrochromogenes]|uniref:hypothetical protein n=1 Tax=Streptomyces erythrochromogenes TaxID=285574 RepID=UPI0037FDE470